MRVRRDGCDETSRPSFGTPTIARFSLVSEGAGARRRQCARLLPAWLGSRVTTSGTGAALGRKSWGRKWARPHQSLSERLDFLPCPAKVSEGPGRRGRPERVPHGREPGPLGSFDGCGGFHPCAPPSSFPRTGPHREGRSQGFSRSIPSPVALYEEGPCVIE